MNTDWNAGIFICVWFDQDLSKYQLITYSGATAESLNKPAICEYAQGNVVALDGS